MNRTGENDLVSELGLFDESANDETQKQWKTICDCLEQMQVWTGDHCGSPSPTPNLVPQPIAPICTTQKQSVTNPAPNPTPFMKYRKSDGDLHSMTSSKLQASMSPPQSAPVLFEGAGEFNWDNSSSNNVAMKSHLRSKSAQNTDVLGGQLLHVGGSELRNSPTSENESKPYAILRPNHTDQHSNNNMYLRHLPSAQVLTAANNSGSYLNQNHHHQHVVVPDKPSSHHPHHLHSSSSSSSSSSSNFSPYAIPTSSSPYNPRSSQLQGGHSLYQIQQQQTTTMEGSSSSSKLSPATNRKHLQPPTTQVKETVAGRLKVGPPVLAAATKVHGGAMHYNINNMNKPLLPTPAAAFPSQKADYSDPIALSYTRDKSKGGSESQEEDEKGYTIVLLQHQRDRMNRLQSEYQLKKGALTTLLHNIQGMEQQLAQRNLRYKAVPVLPSLQQEIGKLREENRQLEIDCNCMYKEVDFYARDGDSTRDDFYSRYNRNSTQVSKQPGKHKSRGSSSTTTTATIAGTTSSSSSSSVLPSSVVGVTPAVATPSTSSTVVMNRIVQQQPASLHTTTSTTNEADDDVKWRCRHCTFDNHSALENCEICEYRRDTHPS